MTIYYTYCSYETDRGLEGLLYIGFRKCPVGKTPETDNYYGTQTSKKNQDFKNNPNKDKVILGVFNNKAEALAHEIELHNLHDVAKNPGFANQAKQTSKGFSTAGMKHSPKACQKISEAQKGKKLSPETRKKMSESMKGEKNPNFGKKFGPETLQQMSESHKGEKNPMYGRSHDPETIQKMSDAKKGKKLRPEHRQKMTGPRPSLSGERNPNFDHTLYNFENKELGIVEMQVTKYYLRGKYELNKSHLAKLVKGGCRQHKGWTTLL